MTEPNHADNPDAISQASDFEPVRGRLFIAIDPPEYVREAVSKLREEDRAKELSWVASEKLHITLAFLGEVDGGRQIELMRRLPEIRVRPFFLALEGVGAFPAKGRPQVLWAGLAPADPLLFQLPGKIEQLTIDLGFEPERRRYQPHLTVARCRGRAETTVRRILKKRADFGTAPFRVEGFTFYASRSGDAGTVYSKLLRVDFD